MIKKLTLLISIVLVINLFSLVAFAAPTDILLHGDAFGAGEGAGAPQIVNSTILGTKFTVAEGKELKSLKYENMPTYTSTVNKFTFKLFKWNTDYSTTIAGTPVFTETVENHVDNQNRIFTFTESVKSGDYLAVLCDGSGTGGAPAFWTSKPIEGVETYWCGELRTDFTANITATVDDATQTNPSTGDTGVILPMILVAVAAFTLLAIKNKKLIRE